jgi:hypothetical protein
MVYRNILILFVLISITGTVSALGTSEGETEMQTYLLLDDFSGERSALNTQWEGFTDQVMGGVSEMSVTRVSDSEGNRIRMKGKVSLKNNGGFIQIRLKLTSSMVPFDGGRYEGIRVSVRGEGSGYYIFLRTTATIFPWKYYAAPVPVTDRWQSVEIPWSAFKPGDYGNLAPLKVSKIKSLALVAYGKEFDADIELKEIGLY